MSETTGREAVAAIDRLLGDRPNKVGHDFSAATRHLAAWRDALVERWRRSAAENDRHALERVNAGLSVILGGQFPLGQVPWSEIQRVRQDLSEIAGEATDQSATPAGSSSHTT
jgi:formate dehydrogenase major subunit